MFNKMIIAILLLTSITFAADDWLHNYEEAVKIAKQDNKKIVLYFSGSDWCRPCILLKKKVFETEEFKKYANEHLVMVQFDFPAREQNKLSEEQTVYNENMADRFNQDGDFPKVVLLTSDEKTIANFVGYGNESVADYITKIKNAALEKDQ